MLIYARADTFSSKLLSSNPNPEAFETLCRELGKDHHRLTALAFVGPLPGVRSRSLIWQYDMSEPRRFASRLQQPCLLQELGPDMQRPPSPKMTLPMAWKAPASLLLHCLSLPVLGLHGDVHNFSLRAGLHDAPVHGRAGFKSHVDISLHAVAFVSEGLSLSLCTCNCDSVYLHTYICICSMHVYLPAYAHTRTYTIHIHTSHMSLCINIYCGYIYIYMLIYILCV